MIKKDEWNYFIPEQAGITVKDGYCLISAACDHAKQAGIMIRNEKKKEELKIPFSEEGKRGSLYGIAIKLSALQDAGYVFYQEDKYLADSYMRSMKNHDKWGSKPGTAYANFPKEDIFDWEEDVSPCISYEDSFFYCLNVRAFTAHKSSGVKNRGTFEGIYEKADYLKNLGVTAIELMPCYEFMELEDKTDQVSQTMNDAIALAFQKEEKKEACNCWGYTQGYYYAPKASYSAIGNADLSFKKLVKKLHQQKIEVIMQFYFTNQTKRCDVIPVLKYWVSEYHIDGIHLMGENLPLQMIAEDPFLKTTKIMYYGFPYEEIYAGDLPEIRNLASYNDSFRTEIRKLLKGDEGMINSFLNKQKSNPAAYGIINYVTNYDGFTLCDLVTYDRKHNEANGENNQDGTDFNYSWNCGIEGPSRKKAIAKLRLGQMKNALAMLFLSQGTPLIYSGDELCNTRYGNNNPYNQDNETGWVKWNETAASKEIQDFIRQLTALRKSNQILHMDKEPVNLDSLGCGYPDLSYHGREAWRPALDYISRSIGLLYCSRYTTGSTYYPYLYLAFNMNWQMEELALPKLPKGLHWQRILTTISEEYKKDESSKAVNETKKVTDMKIMMMPRCIAVYVAEKEA